jgi:hypothetical protein
MTAMGDIKSRMETVRAQSRRHRFNTPDEWLGALKRAEEYFDCRIFGEKYDQAAALRLAIAMAQVLFGRPGRGRQIKDWTEDKLRLLGRGLFYRRFYSKSGARLRDAQYARLVSEERPPRFGANPELIRQKLPAARRAFIRHCAEVAISAYPDDEDRGLLREMGLLDASGCPTKKALLMVTGDTSSPKKRALSMTAKELLRN